MLSTWILDEVKTAKLNDKRLNATPGLDRGQRRFGQVLSQLAARPTASIPAACGGRAEMVAAYRFCENKNTSFDRVLEPHMDATQRRIAVEPVVLLAQDTTEIDVTRPEQQVAARWYVGRQFPSRSAAALDACLYTGWHSVGHRGWNRMGAGGGAGLRIVVSRPASRHPD